MMFIYSLVKGVRLTRRIRRRHKATVEMEGKYIYICSGCDNNDIQRAMSTIVSFWNARVEYWKITRAYIEKFTLAMERFPDLTSKELEFRKKL